MNRQVWRDGKLIGWNEATVSALAHPMQRGSLVFDVMSFHDTPRGVAVFRLREHVRRFLRSCAIVGLAPAFDEEQLVAATRETVVATGLRDGLIRMSGFPPDLEADLVPRDPYASVVIAAYSRDDLPKNRKAPPILRIHVPRDTRKAAPDAIPPLAKVAAAYLGPMLARRRALDAGFNEIVMLDHAGNVAEAPTANIMCVIGGEIVTPALGTILDGITRDSIVALAMEEGIACTERDMTYAELAAADEAFLTATSYLVAPIATIDEHEKTAPGPITARLKTRFMKVIAGDDPRSAEWLTPVTAG